LFPASFFTFIDFIEELGKTFIDFIGEDGVFWGAFMALTAFIEDCDAFILVFKISWQRSWPCLQKEAKAKDSKSLTLESQVTASVAHIQFCRLNSKWLQLYGNLDTMTAKPCRKMPQ